MDLTVFHCMVEARIELMKLIEKIAFIVPASRLEGSFEDIEGPKLEYFLNNVITLIRILSTPVRDLNTALAFHPFGRFQESTEDLWVERWQKQLGTSEPRAENRRKRWDECTCGLCDAIFSLWPVQDLGFATKESRNSACELY